MESDSVLRNRMKELELSHKTLLVMIDQLNMKVHHFENANMRIKGKLREVWEELLSLVENQEKSEKKQKEKLHWLQEQLKTKENEVKSQSEYFEHYKQRQKQQTTVLRKSECYLRGEVFRLEKQVLDLSAHIALLTSELGEGMAQSLHKKLESVSEGTQSCKLSNMQLTELKNSIGNVERDMKSHFESFQKNLKFLRDKEEGNRRERTDLLTQLQCSQDTEDFLRRKLEESCHHVYNLKLSEINLQEQVNKLLDENKDLKYQARVRLKKKEEKDSHLKRPESTDNITDLNRDLHQQGDQNQKMGAISDQRRSRAAQTPVVLLHATEYETPGYSCDGPKQTKQQQELLPVLEHNSSTFANTAEELGLAEIKLVTLGAKCTGALEDSFTLFRCTPSYPTARLLPPCSEKVTNGETSEGNKDEEYRTFSKEQAIHLPSKMFPVSVVEDLMRNKTNVILLKPESCEVDAVRTVKKVWSLDFSGANTNLCLDGLCVVTEEGFSDKLPTGLFGKIPYSVTENVAFFLQKYRVEKHQQQKLILPKGLTKNKSSNKSVHDRKYYQKIFRSRIKGEEIQNEKSQVQLLTSVFGENSNDSNKSGLVKPEKQGIETKGKQCSPQGVHKISVDVKDFHMHFRGSPEQVETQGRLSEICVSDVMRVCKDGDMMKMGGKEKKPQKTTPQINPSRNIGLEVKKVQSLKLHESNEKNFSCQEIAAENMEYAYPQKCFWSEEKGYSLNILCPMQKRSLCLSKQFLPEKKFSNYFCHLSPPTVVHDHNMKTHALEKLVAMCSQRIFLLTQENENYFKKVCVLQEENERCVQKVCALEEDMNACFQYALEVDEDNIVSFQNLLNEDEIVGKRYNMSEGNAKSPGAIFAKAISKNLSYIEEKSRNLGKDSLTIESNKLPKSVLPLDGKKIRYFQLLSDLKEERRKCFKEIAKLLQEKENYIEKYNELMQERERNLKRISFLEGEKENLLGSLAEIKCEQDKYRALVSELQECKSSCYQTISVLREEKCVLKGAIDKIKKENAERIGEFQKANAEFILENNKLKELMYSLGFTYEDLRKENSLGTKEKVAKIKEENKTQQYGDKPMKVKTACSVTQTEEEGTDPFSYFHKKEGSGSENYSAMEEQLEKTKEELKTQQKELEKSKKEAQKWYRELGFAETRYEEIKTYLTHVLSELDCLKQEAGDKTLGKQHCRFVPMYTMKSGQEIEDNKIASKRLQQQVLTLKAQLRDQTALQNQFNDLQNKVELLQAQLCEKTRELQKRKSEAVLTLAPLKAKLACLTRKCQERNSFITRMHAEFRRQGFNNSMFDEEVRSLVNDVALAEYTATFTCNQEMLPSSTVISEASGQSENHEALVRVSRMSQSIPANSLQEADGIHSSHITPNMYTSSPVKLTSPERIIAFHRELRQNHQRNCQIPSFVSSNTNSKADPNLSMTREETPWPPLPEMKDALKRDWSMQGRDCLSKWDDAFGGQIGNQHASAIPQGIKQKDVITNNAWLSREKTDGSTSATTAKSSLSDMLSASNKGQNPVGGNQLHGKE
ncbi:uncharacterized protein C4orf50 homolog isoform X1 [Coturnix japonica]|nr:uncharacterized protein C4orf50 homolog isoform X1 [Coturnix japonica]XP_032300023.1 uncharacterized protein C4orf50 homolog isoform X1 [Coturnix japonica]